MGTRGAFDSPAGTPLDSAGHGGELADHGSSICIQRPVSIRRFAFKQLASDRRPLALRIVLTAGALWLVVVVHELLEGTGSLSLERLATLAGLMLVLSAVIWLAVASWRGR